MNSKILITVVLLLIVSGAIARQCYKCNACPTPFEGNKAGVEKVDVGDDEFCEKSTGLITGLTNRRNGGSGCTPLEKIIFCCKDNLCNGATTATLSVKLLVATASLFFAMRFLH